MIDLGHKMTKGIVLSLYDFTGEALKPWAEANKTMEMHNAV